MVKRNLVLIVLLLLIHCACSEIYYYDEYRLSSSLSYHEYFNSPHIDSYININLNFSWDLNEINPIHHVYVFVYQEKFHHLIDFLSSTLDDNFCFVPERIINDFFEYTDDLAVYNTTFLYNGSIIENKKIETEGKWGVLVYYCCLTRGSHTYINGEIVLHHEHGYLSAIDYPFIFDYAILGVLFSIFFGVWTYFAIKFRRNSILLHKAIILITFVGALSSFITACIYYLKNDAGYSGLFLYLSTLPIIFLQILERSLLLYHTSGGDLTDLPIKKVGIVVISIICVAGSCAYVLLPDVFESKEISVESLFYVRECLNMMYTLWVLASIGNTIRKLKSQNYIPDIISRYQRTGIFLFVIIFLSASILGASKVLQYMDYQKIYWKVWHLRDTFIYLIEMAIIANIAITWRPSSDNNKYRAQSDIFELVIQEE